MDMKEEMMSDAVDDVMDEEEDEEEEGDKILKQVLDEIGVDLSQQACFSYYPLIHLFSSPGDAQLTDAPTGITTATKTLADRQPVAIGDHGGSSAAGTGRPGDNAGGGGGGATLSDEDALQARLDALRRG